MLRHSEDPTPYPCKAEQEKGGQVKTTKPCPGCGTVVPWRTANKVCPSCAALLDAARKRNDKIEEMAKNPELVSVLLPWAIHAYPYIQHANAVPGGKTDHEFYSAVDTLLRCSGVLPPGDDKWKWGESRPVFPYLKSFGNGPGHDATLLRLEKPVYELWLKVWSAVVEMVDNAYRNGHADGSNLLARLASNEITITELNYRQEKI